MVNLEIPFSDFAWVIKCHFIVSNYNILWSLTALIFMSLYELMSHHVPVMLESQNDGSVAQF